MEQISINEALMVGVILQGADETNVIGLMRKAQQRVVDAAGGNHAVLYTPRLIEDCDECIDVAARAAGVEHIFQD